MAASQGSVLAGRATWDQAVARGRAVARLWQIPAAFLGLFVVSFAVYWPILGDFFALDDYVWLQAASNPDPADFFRRAFAGRPATLFDAPTPFWRPAIDTYFFIMWRVFGLEALPYHVANVAIHGAVASLLAVLVWQLTSSRVTGLIAALLFVVLPTYDIAVPWISSATELLAALFFVMTLVLYTAYLQGRGPTGWLYWSAWGALLLALLSKESTVTLPVVLAGIVVVIALPRSPRDVLRRARELAPFVVLTIAYAIFVLSQEYSSDDGLYRFGWHGLGNMWGFVKVLSLPLPDSSASWVETARPFFAIGFLVAGSAALFLRSRLLGMVFVWTLLALLPYSFFRAGIEHRYTYLAAIPFTIFVVLLARVAYTRAVEARIVPVIGKYPAAALAAVPLVILMLVFAAEARDRHERFTLFADDYEQFFRQVPALCGNVPRESHIFVLNSPVFDLFGGSTRMAMNLRYEDVYVNVSRGGTLPELAPFIESKCVARYSDGRYVLEPG